MTDELVSQALGYEVICQGSEMAPWPIVILNQELSLQFQNTAFTKLISLPLGAGFASCVAPSCQKLFARFAQRHFEKSPLSEEILPLRCSLLQGGVKKYVEIEGCLRSQPGSTWLVLYLKDLTAAIRSQRAKRQQYRQLRSIIDNTGAVIYVKDRQGRYEFVNRLFEELFHVTQQQIHGKTDYDLFEEVYAERYRMVDQAVCDSGETQRIQEGVLQDDGLHTFITVKFPLHDLQGKVTGLAGISTDITEQLWAEQEIQAAQAVQKLLYPDQAPVYSGYEIAGHVSPAETTSGDYYDYIWLSPTRLVIAVGDVSGHGLGPALEMVETRAYLRAILRTEVRLDVTMECLNEFLYRDLRDSAFVTLFLAEINFETHTFQYVGAGHRADFLRTDQCWSQLKSTGLMLGMQSHVKYTCSPELPFEQGDLLMVTTDGIYEARTCSGDILGHQQMLEMVTTLSDRPAGEIIQNLVHRARHQTPNGIQADDMTAVVVKRLPCPNSRD